ncbi:hypothetical protein HPB47_000113 [Ixodes persulcatus]|uniref:Uncharacterized protein n=1 Tax=Ixodes persulcatus TaxID=34615 RepID=A0AC60PTZ7_IXOPE|nr:hypothetical protein HPB47_000113 [Ixodes persulcatus]
MHTCKVVLVTSLVWFALAGLLLMYYTECIGSGCLPKSSSSLDRVPSSKSLQSPQGEFRSWVAVELKQNPSDWPGENGRGVEIGKDEEALKKEKFKLNQFNLLASDRIALNRSLPDVRLEKCKDKVYPEKLPTTSVVIVFHNEAWSTLLRTVHSVIRTSPRALLEEIILVDDASEREHLGKQLEDYVVKLDTPVKVMRTGKRSGLIRARLLGAAAVKGQVITFLDAHCECTQNWLEPLLARIAEDRTRVVCPVIDVISDETFEYISASDLTWGGFNWKLNFRWYRVPQRELDRRGGDRTLPVRTPTMAGGLFAIDKDYFVELGKYDEGMDIWGGENLELSFRVMYGFVLSFWDESVLGSVWNASGAAKNVDKGDLSHRRNLRKKLKCNSFRWYLENIYPESHMPLDYYHLGEIKHADSPVCLDTFGRKSGENVAVSTCHGQGGNQVFAYTKRQQIMSDDNCLDASSPRGPVKLLRCHGMGGNQLWIYDKEEQTFKHVNTARCLDQPASSDPSLPVLKECDGRSSQRWVMQGKFKWQAS